ncbi:hypothetical protein H8699_09135 [Christensenellaceae bacterium NSJ-44]|uniref:Uncharacterized protein n=1 Tax=Luoshenia tenuis TaxID=2763654 RepID=A0A926D1L0_9FIRM|nr:hypothetical protein [Luoshenia tenuis]MBC8529588.1 hypothetical protein [Luoshenia tenuis]
MDFISLIAFFSMALHRGFIRITARIGRQETQKAGYRMGFGKGCALRAPRRVWYDKTVEKPEGGKQDDPVQWQSSMQSLI